MMTGPKAPRPYEEFGDDHPEVLQAYEALGLAVRQAGALSPREIALVKLAIAAGARLEGAVRAHVRRAAHMGIDRKDLKQVLLLAIPTIGFPSSMAAITWANDEMEKPQGD